MKLFLLLSALSFLLLDGCATSRESGRAKLVVPSEVGAVYSDVELQAKLAFKPDIACQQGSCGDEDAFRGLVQRLGERLGEAATALAADLQIEAPHFSVSIPGKNDIGTLSSASGNVIVFDGVRMLALTDPALAFLIAREMGHVLAKHHEENTATGLTVSVAVAILFPVTGLLQGMEAAYTASRLATTATSFAGSRIVRGFYQDEQQREADGYAMLILARAGWTPQEVALALHAAASHLDGDGWVAELRGSMHWLDAIVTGPMPEQPSEHPEALAVADIPHERFGPVFDSDTLWIAGLLHGASGVERLCGVRLPAANARPANKLVTAKPVKQAVKKTKKILKGKRPGQRASQKRPQPA